MRHKILKKFIYFAYIGFSLTVTGAIIYAISGKIIWPLIIIGGILSGIYLGAYLASKAISESQLSENAEHKDN